jgi:hypothetical protein
MPKTLNEPHGDTTCGAKNRQGRPCGNRPLANGRCKYHGGLSAGPRTPEGLERSRKANSKHGFYSAASIERRRHFRRIMTASRKTLVEMEGVLGIEPA